MKRESEDKAKVIVDRVRVKPGDLTTGCPSVAPFMYSSLLLPQHQPVLEGELPHLSPPRLPVLGKLAGHLHEGWPTSPCINPEAPLVSSWSKAMASGPLGIQLGLQLWSISSHCAVVTWTSLLFFRCADHIPVSGPLHFCSLYWECSFLDVSMTDFIQVCYQMLPSQRGLLWPPPTQAKEFPLSLSFFLLCSDFLPIPLGIIFFMQQIIVRTPQECEFHDGRDLECFVVHCSIPRID